MTDPRATPMMQQYREAKAAHPGMLLLFRMGDFYELFDDDAVLASRVLNLTLTSRDKQIPMAGFPHHQLEQYLKKLLHGGHRVAVCDQVEDASQAKGLVRREVTRVVTAGTVTEDELLDPRRPNHLAAVWGHGGVVGLAWADLTAGDFRAADVPADRLADELGRLQPSECLIAESDLQRHGDALRAVMPRTLTPRPDLDFDPKVALGALLGQFGVFTLEGFGFVDEQPAVTAAGSLLLYLKETLRTPLGHFRALRAFRHERYLVLDEVTRRSLELTHTLRDGGRDGSLLAVLDRTVTPMGARLLHEWLLAPLADTAAIAARHDAVDELVHQHALRSDLRDLLVACFDLQRLTARAGTGRATPRDLASIGKTLALLPKIKAELAGRRSNLLADLDQRLELFPDLRSEIESALIDSPPLSPKDGGLIADGFDAGLDELRSIARDGKTWIAQYQAREITRTGIASLKVGFNQVFGYYIEITNANADRVPPDYVRKQTLKNCERYVTGDLKEYEEKVLGAEDKIRALEYELFLKLRDTVAGETPRLIATAEVLAALDVLAGLAELAATRNYVRPVLTDEPVTRIVDGRHPVLDQTIPTGVLVPNDTDLSPAGGRFWLITGPNMAGKSIFIRQVALLTLLGQVGSFVPAKSATLGVADRIFTRVGASDEVSRGQSTFMVEMTEAANILNNATSRSLVILDEIGRGTSTYDGVSLAWAIAEYLHDVIGCRTLFATHYHELAQLADSLPGLRNYTVRVLEESGRVAFLHKVEPGAAAKSYGVHVAKLAGVPASVIDRAGVVLTQLEAHHKLSAGPRAKVPPRPKPVDPPERPRKKKAPAGPSLFADDCF